VAIRPLTTDTAPAVFSFLDQIVGSRGAEHWRWKYPLDRPGAPPGFFWEEAGGEILGFIGLMHTALQRDGREWPVAWFVDWHVPAHERAVGVGLGLLRKAEAVAGTLLTLQGTAHTRQMLPRLGWHESRAVATWVRPLSARMVGAWARRRLPRGFRKLASLFPLLGFGPRRLARPANPLSSELKTVERVGSEYDSVWQTRAGESEAVMRRDSSYLNHMCADYPGGGYHLQLLLGGGAPIGHLIYRINEDRRGMRRGRLVDLAWPRSRPDLMQYLVDAGTHALQEGGADYVECMAAAPELGEGLRRRGFRSRVPVTLWYHRLPEGAPHPDNWFLSLLDCDRAYR